MNKDYLHLSHSGNLQTVPQKNGMVNVHITVGSIREKGGYSYGMNLLKAYEEKLSKWKKNGLVVTKKYIRHPDGLTFSADQVDRIKTDLKVRWALAN